jgi:hypothetical protein
MCIILCKNALYIIFKSFMIECFYLRAMLKVVMIHTRFFLVVYCYFLFAMIILHNPQIAPNFADSLRYMHILAILKILVPPLQTYSLWLHTHGGGKDWIVPFPFLFHIFQKRMYRNTWMLSKIYRVDVIQIKIQILCLVSSERIWIRYKVSK